MLEEVKKKVLNSLEPPYWTLVLSKRSRHSQHFSNPLPDSPWMAGKIPVSVKMSQFTPNDHVLWSDSTTGQLSRTWVMCLKFHCGELCDSIHVTSLFWIQFQSVHAQQGDWEISVVTWIWEESQMSYNGLSTPLFHYLSSFQGCPSEHALWAWLLLRPQGIQCPRTVRKSEDTDSILCNLGSATSSLSLGLSCSVGGKKRNKYQLQGICNLKNHIAYEKMFGIWCGTSTTTICSSWL